ncbi:MAG TPA: hypothetical protein VNZ68_07750 [Rhodocyclaceae bacterium]|nr:hypothetical protein [Rhodocyclaceae bacterium]
MNSDQQQQGPQFVPQMVQQQGVQGSSTKQPASPVTASEEVAQVAQLGYN